MAYAPLVIGTPQHGGSSFVNADGTTAKTLVTAHSTNGSRVEHLSIWCDEAKVVNIYRANNAGTILGLIAQISLSASVSVDVLATLYALPEKQFIVLKANEKITWAPTVVVTAAKTLYAQWDGGDF